MSSNLNLQSGSILEPGMQVACVYALSGTYGTLPRFLYYATVVLAIFGRNQEWLVIGALVSSLTYAATAGIHVMALCTSRQGVFDLDALGAWAILSTAALSYVAMMHWSSTLRNSKAKIVMICWGVLIGIALVFNRAVLYDQSFDDFEDPCYSSDGSLLTTPLELSTAKFNCSYTCFNISKPMRGKDEIMVTPQSVLNNEYTKLSYILVGPIMFVAYVAVSWQSVQHTPGEACIWLVMKHLNPRIKEDLVKSIYNASQERWYGGYFMLFHYIKSSPWSVRKVVLSSITYPWILLCFLMDVLCLPFMVINVVLNELRLLGSDIPVNEAIYNVGQWSPVVNSALVVIAAIIQKSVEVWQDRKAKKQRKQLVETLDLRRSDTDATLVDPTQADMCGPSKAWTRYSSRVDSELSEYSSRTETRLV